MGDMKPGEKEFIEKMMLELARDSVKPNSFARPRSSNGWRMGEEVPKPHRRRRRYF